MAVETLTRTVESSALEQVSKATFKGFQLTFTEKRNEGNLISLVVSGYKSTNEAQGESVSYSYTPQNGDQRARISFTPSSALDAELAAALDAELEILKAPVE